MEDVGLSSPIPLIEIDSNEAMRSNPVALDLLRKIDPASKVSVVCVCGIYRSGKSSLMNWLLGTNTWSGKDGKKGFTVGPSVNRCTRGIWMWGAPRPGVLPSGEPCSVIILDTEGIGGIEADSQYDARIFSLALLLCSSLIYNSMGSIDETAIANLSFVAQLSSHIHISSKAAEDATAAADEALNFHKIFPSFLWVIRDFTLNLVDTDGDPISGTQYLNSSLMPVKGFDKQTSERNRIRSMLTSFFSNRNCVTLVRPCNNEELLQQVDLIPFEELRPEFQEQIKCFRELVFGNLIPKSLEGRVLNGLMFAGLVESYVSAINGGGVPTLSTAWESISEQESLAAFENAVTGFEKEVNEFVSTSLPVDSADLDLAVDSAAQNASQFFKSRAVGVSSVEYLGRLDVEIKEQRCVLHAMNKISSKEFCANLADRFYGSALSTFMADESVVRDTDFMDNYKAVWTTFSKSYLAEAKGPAVHRVLSEYYFSKFLASMQQQQILLKDSFAKEIRILRSEVAALESNVHSLTSERDVLQIANAEIESKLRESDKQVRNLSSLCAQHEATVASLTENLRTAKKLEEENADNIKRSENKILLLTSKVTELEASQREMDDLRIQYSKSQEEVKGLNTSLEIAWADRHSADRNIASLHVEVEKRDEEIRTLKASVEAAAVEQSRTEKSYEALLIKLTSLMATDYVPKFDLLPDP